MSGSNIDRLKKQNKKKQRLGCNNPAFLDCIMWWKQEKNNPQRHTDGKAAVALRE